MGSWRSGRLGLLAAAMLMLGQAAHAGTADVVAVEVEQTAPGVYVFRVTLLHDDEGWDHYADRWDHYADRWDVLAPDGRLLGERVLAQPHVGEQPFTRSLSGVVIDDATKTLILRGHDSVHGLGGVEMTVDLPQ